MRAATTGESTAGRTTLFTTVLKSIAPAPPATQVAPIRPPNSACEELEGSPRSQVTRFHTIAPTSPAKITTGSMSVSSTRPPEMVFATWAERKAPITFRHPASATAVRGRNAPVAIDVAIAFAVSWKPFVKSKTSAVITTTTTISHTSMDSVLRSADGDLARGCRLRCRGRRAGAAPAGRARNALLGGGPCRRSRRPRSRSPGRTPRATALRAVRRPAWSARRGGREPRRGPSAPPSYVPAAAVPPYRRVLPGREGMVEPPGSRLHHPCGTSALRRQGRTGGNLREDAAPGPAPIATTVRTGTSGQQARENPGLGGTPGAGSAGDAGGGFGPRPPRRAAG